jgi:hypothetical protein
MDKVSRHYGRQTRLPLFLFALFMTVMLAITSCGSRVTEPLPTATPVPSATLVPGEWRVTQEGDDLRIAFGVSPSFPQYVSLDRLSGYLRLVNGPDANFGTSTLLVPALWVQEKSLCPLALPADGAYCQGAQVTVETHEESPFLIIHVTGVTAGLAVTTDVRLARPALNLLSAHVTTTVVGNAQLFPRPGETFKLVTLNSMHVSATQWDAKRAHAKTPDPAHFFDLPDAPTDNEFIGDSAAPISAQIFGLEGGTSFWKTNAPTIEVAFDGRPVCQVLGYVTKSADPRDDNISYWCATDHIVSSWAYSIRAFSGSP